MKWLPAFCYLFFAVTALAEDASTPAVKPLRGATLPNVQVIDGKRFFSLQNVHRYTGGPNSPQALSVLHHPRQDKPFARTISQPTASAPLAMGAHTPEALPKSTSDQLLSIFAPEDKGLATTPSIK